MKLTQNSVQTASDLMQDDHFEIGGFMYRIASMQKNGCMLVLGYYAFENAQAISYIAVPSDLPFKSFNQCATSTV